MAKAINNKILTINVDESSFSNELWNERSWLKRGVNSEIKSMRFRGSVSLILAVTSDGDYFGATIKSRLNSDSFIDFILKLEDWIEQRNIRNGREIIVILDNCSIHRSKVTKEALKETKIKFWYLPQYSPSLAPVELVFAQLKKIYKEQRRSEYHKMEFNRWSNLTHAWIVFYRELNNSRMMGAHLFSDEFIHD